MAPSAVVRDCGTNQPAGQVLASVLSEWLEVLSGCSGCCPFGCKCCPDAGLRGFPVVGAGLSGADRLVQTLDKPMRPGCADRGTGTRERIRAARHADSPMRARWSSMSTSKNPRAPDLAHARGGRQITGADAGPVATSPMRARWPLWWLPSAATGSDLAHARGGRPGRPSRRRRPATSPMRARWPSRATTRRRSTPGTSPMRARWSLHTSTTAGSASDLAYARAVVAGQAMTADAITQTR